MKIRGNSTRIEIFQDLLEIIKPFEDNKGHNRKAEALNFLQN
jgi:hypothetical protein